MVFKLINLSAVAVAVRGMNIEKLVDLGTRRDKLDLQIFFSKTVVRS